MTNWIIFTIFFIIVTTTLQAQYISPRPGGGSNNARPVAEKNQWRKTIGIGIGMQYGGVGGRFQIYTPEIFPKARIAGHAGAGIIIFNYSEMNSTVSGTFGYGIGVKANVSAFYVGISQVGFIGISETLFNFGLEFLFKNKTTGMTIGLSHPTEGKEISNLDLGIHWNF